MSRLGGWKAGLFLEAGPIQLLTLLDKTVRLEHFQVKDAAQGIALNEHVVPTESLRVGSGLLVE